MQDSQWALWAHCDGFPNTHYDSHFPLLSMCVCTRARVLSMQVCVPTYIGEPTYIGDTQVFMHVWTNLVYHECNGKQNLLPNPSSPPKKWKKKKKKDKKKTKRQKDKTCGITANRVHSVLVHLTCTKTYKITLVGELLFRKFAHFLMLITFYLVADRPNTLPCKFRNVCTVNFFCVRWQRKQSFGIEGSWMRHLVNKGFSHWIHYVPFCHKGTVATCEKLVGQYAWPDTMKSIKFKQLLIVLLNRIQEKLSATFIKMW